jgi:hypothetical protein
MVQDAKSTTRWGKSSKVRRQHPRAGEGHDVPIAQLLDSCEVVTRSICSIGDDDDLLTPYWLLKGSQHLAKQGIFGLVPRIVFASKPRKIHRDAIAAPPGYEEYDPKAEDVRMGWLRWLFLSHWVLGAPFAFERAVGYQIEETMFRRWKGL